jgi:hypothetical protein
MAFVLRPVAGGTSFGVTIDCNLPTTIVVRILGDLFPEGYDSWCTRQMVHHAVNAELTCQTV